MSGETPSREELKALCEAYPASSKRMDTKNPGHVFQACRYTKTAIGASRSTFSGMIRISASLKVWATASLRTGSRGNSATSACT